MLNMFLGVFVLGILVFIHELGHYLAAKFCKIPVLMFSIGFGPKLISKKIGETEYQIRVIPFGGFVAMDEGKNAKESAKVFSSGSEEHPIWKRALVAFSGPAFNIIFAFMFLVAMYMIGVPHAPFWDTNRVGLVSSESPAYGKIERGDEIISINGRAVSGWQEIFTKFSDMSPEHSIVFVRRSAGASTGDTLSALISVALPDARTLESRGAGIFPPIPPVIGAVEENSAAYSAGFKAGDSIISINGAEISSWYAVSETISRYNDSLGAISVVVARGGGEIDLSVQPRFNIQHERWLIGIIMANPSTQIKRYTLFPSLKLAFDDCIKYSQMIFSTLRKLITRLVSPEYLSGPVGIMQMSGAAAQSGVSSLLQLLALIGINLGLLNLMPLVITDGGVLSLLLVEAIRGKPVSAAVREKLSYVFMVAFLCLAVFVTFNDILRFGAVENLLR